MTRRSPLYCSYLKLLRLNFSAYETADFCTYQIKSPASPWLKVKMCRCFVITHSRWISPLGLA